MGGLFGSSLLDVAIGLAFVYLLLAIVCTAVNEWIAAATGARAKMLSGAVRRLLDKQPLNAASAGDPGSFLAAFYKHPVIDALKGLSDSHPSYIPSRAFVTTVMDLATPAVKGTITYADLQNGLKELPDGDVKRALLALVQNAGDQLDVAQKNIETWFDDAMDRVSGWYKRRSQMWTLIIAALVSVGVNADTVRISQRLWSDPTMRAAVVEQARIRAQQPAPAPAAGNQILSDEQNLVGQLLGWGPGSSPSGAAGWLRVVAGWVLTIIAVSLGAPFWFDVLNKFMNVRGSGRSPQEANRRRSPPAAQPA